MRSAATQGGVTACETTDLAEVGGSTTATVESVRVSTSVNNFAGGTVPKIKITTPQGSKISRVNHPAHYNAHPSGVECIDIVEEFNFNIGSAIKYLWREGLKETSLDDLRKAQWYITREIDRRLDRGN